MDTNLLYELTASRCERLATELGGAKGRMMNVMFGLQSGDSKADAIRALKSALDIIDAYYASLPQPPTGKE